jgi:hypothetical protein
MKIIIITCIVIVLFYFIYKYSKSSKFLEYFFNDNIDYSKKIIRWKIFVKDFIMWTIMMYIIYLIWKKVLKRTEH